MVLPKVAGAPRAGLLCSADVRAVLLARWPDRAEQVQDLLQELAAPCGAAKPLLVFGAPASGKTAVVRWVSLNLFQMSSSIRYRRQHAPEDFVAAHCHQRKQSHCHHVLLPL